MLKKLAVLLVIFQVFVLPLCLYGQSAESEETIETYEPSYGTYKPEYNPVRKFVRGLVNTAFAVVEVPTQMLKVSRAEGDMAGISWGFTRGLFCMAGRMTWGMFEMATCVFPPYQPVVEPEFVFEED